MSGCSPHSSGLRLVPEETFSEASKPATSRKQHFFSLFKSLRPPKRHCRETSLGVAVQTELKLRYTRVSSQVQVQMLFRGARAPKGCSEATGPGYCRDSRSRPSSLGGRSSLPSNKRSGGCQRQLPAYGSSLCDRVNNTMMLVSLYWECICSIEPTWQWCAQITYIMQQRVRL